MRKTAYISFAGILLLILVITIYMFTGSRSQKNVTANLFMASEEKEKEEGGFKRREYELKLLRDPRTGRIPHDAFEKDAAILSSVIERQQNVNFRPSILNTYTAAGPSQNGGRTRAVAYDMRNNGVMLAAGVSGGIYRSTDGGVTWAFVHPTTAARIVSCLAQDPQTPNTWYAGTGELLGSSPQYPNAFIPGHGLLKSTDNGLTWVVNSFTTTNNSREVFEDLFDMIFNVQVNESGHVFIAALASIWRSTDGGNNFSPILFEIGELDNPDQIIENMITDIVISKPGVTPVRYYASFTGRNRDIDTAGVWTSTSANYGSWVRIGGPNLVTGWRAHNNTIVGGNYTAGWGKTALAVAPNNSNILYVMYDNAQSASSSQSEADLFRADLTSYPSVSWSGNRGTNLRALQNGTTTSYMEVQGGYNMLLAVHPTNSNLVVAGGVNLYKSSDGFNTQGTFIGGNSSTTYSDPDMKQHVDFHSHAFHPSLTNRLVVGSDGGLVITGDITAATVSWANLNNQYQTLQYYHTAIDPAFGSLNFAGGAQDNSTSFRDSKGLLNFAGLLRIDGNDHYTLIGGDGGSVGLSASTATQQYVYGSVQEGDVYRFFINGLATGSPTLISPSAAVGSEFITYFLLDPENTGIMYYAANNVLWRTTSATTATTASGWTEMTGIGSALSGSSIFSLATSRGAYNGNSSYLFMGTENGRIFRLQNPRDAAAATTPVNISPSVGVGMTNGSLVRDIAVNPRNPDTVMAVVSNYGVTSVFWTGNALSATPTWQAIEGATIGGTSFRSCAIVTTSTGVEYYVGTAIGLFSTSAINGASTVWQLEGNAVMQGAIVNDLDLRIADNTLLVATHGNGMFYANIGNVPTSVPDVIVNDKRFINTVFPTVFAVGDLNFRTGNATSIKTINIRITNLNGQVLLQRTQAYQNGTVTLPPLATGSYVLEIMSDNRKYKHIQQFVKTN